MPRKKRFDYRVVFLNAPEKWLYRTKQQITAELGVPYLKINKSYLTDCWVYSPVKKDYMKVIPLWKEKKNEIQNTKQRPLV